MPSHRLATILATALAPCLWGTTYIVFTQTLPVSHPLLVGALRALPAGILLMLLGPGLPPRDKLGRLALVGLANIGVFFALLFVPNPPVDAIKIINLVQKNRQIKLA
ncbi:hypothetical protein ACQCRF_16480, partial [Ralstonia pseudosolanacearum]